MWNKPPPTKDRTHKGIVEFFPVVVDGVTWGIEEHAEAGRANNQGRRSMASFGFTLLLDVQERQHERFWAIKI